MGALLIMVASKSEELLKEIKESLKRTNKDKMEILTDYISDIVNLGDEHENCFFIDTNLPLVCKLTQEEKNFLQEELKKAEEMKILYSNLEKEPEILELHPAQDFSTKEGINYTFITRDGKYIITSRKNIYNYENCLDKGIKLKNKGVKTSKLKPKTVVAYARDNKQVTANNIFQEVLNMIKKYIIFEVESFYTVLTIWIIHTYLFKIFLYIPYLWINRR